MEAGSLEEQPVLLSTEPSLQYPISKLETILLGLVEQICDPSYSVNWGRRFKACLGYRESSRLAKTIQQDPISKTKEGWAHSPESDHLPSIYQPRECQKGKKQPGLLCPS